MEAVEEDIVIANEVAVEDDRAAKDDTTVEEDNDSARVLVLKAEELDDERLILLEKPAAIALDGRSSALIMSAAYFGF